MKKKGSRKGVRKPRFLIGFLIFLNLVLVLATLGSYLATLIPPERFWYTAFAGLSYPFLMAGGLLFLLIWLFIKPRFALISFITLLAGSTIAARHLQLRYPDEFDKNAKEILRVTTFNVRNFDLWAKYGKPDYKTYDQMMDLFMHEPSDILCLQEAVVTHPRTGNLAERTRKELGYAGMATATYTLGGANGMMIFFRGKKLDSGIINHNKRAIALYADIETRQGIMRVYNVHLQSAKLGQESYVMEHLSPEAYSDPEFLKGSKQIVRKLKRAFTLRGQQAQILKEHMRSSPFPVLVCGDFNDTPCSYTYSHIRKGLQDTFVNAGRGLGRTYHGKFPSYRIDYILVSGVFKVRSHHIGSGRFGDHHPVSAYLEMTKKAP